MDFVMPSVMPSDDDSKLTEAYRKLRESEVTKDDKISEKVPLISHVWGVSNPKHT
jgi:hypothetical protein